MRGSKTTRLLPTAALACGIAVLAAGCENALEPKVYGGLTPETFFGSEADFNNAVVALYAPFSADWGSTDQGIGVWYAALYNADPKTYWSRSESTTDELFTPWDAVIPGFAWGPATFNGDATYTKIRYVARATDVIDKIQKSNANVPAEVKARYIAEAKALRGWLNFILYDFFGPVNSKLDPATLSSTEITPRPSAAEFVAAIEQDLTEAIPDLRDKYNGDAANWGRVGQGTARMVLLRLYMHEKDWAKAEAVAREIVEMGYSLVPNYADVCDVERNPEIIYAVPASAASPNWYFQEVLPTDFMTATTSAGTIAREPGWYGYWMPWSFFDTYEPTDERLGTIVSTYEATWGGTVTRNNWILGAVPLKCTKNLGGGSGSSNDWPVFRYAETLLSLAEAINEQRGPAEAYEYVNLVRARAEVAEWSGLTQAQLRDSLLAERGRELYSEGVRRQDLIRHGKFIEYAQARGLPAQPHHVLFPIPLSVIEEGGGIIQQNPGY